MVDSLLSSAIVLTIFTVEDACYGLLDLSLVMERDVDAFAVAFDFFTIN